MIIYGSLILVLFWCCFYLRRGLAQTAAVAGPDARSPQCASRISYRMSTALADSKICSRTHWHKDIMYPDRLRVILVAVALTGLSRSYAQDVGVGQEHGTRGSDVATSADVDVVDVEDVTQAAVIDSDAETNNGVDSPERFVCRPHITVQVPPSLPVRHGCNCSDGGSSAEAEKQTANLVRQLQELVQFCRAGDGGNQGGRQTGAGGPIGGSSDGSQQIYEALTDLTTVLKRFQTPGIPVPGSLISLPKDCSEVLSRGATTSGVYTIQTLDSGRPFQVYCDMETDGGGWTVFQKRQDGSVDFFRGYASYRRGFGDLNGEFWLGNDQIHRLTSQDEYHLRIDLEDFDLGTEFAEYRIFRVSDANEDYRLTIGSYYGTAGDALTTHSGQPFTTKDRDNDNWASKNCAKEYHGAWWYNSCFYASLNGEYLRGSSESYGTGIVWYQWRGYYYSLKRTEMKIRPAD